LHFDLGALQTHGVDGTIYRGDDLPGFDPIAFLDVDSLDVASHGSGQQRVSITFHFTRHRQRKTATRRFDDHHLDTLPGKFLGALRLGLGRHLLRRLLLLLAASRRKENGEKRKC
jgi:hypothetical protein